MVKRRMNQPGYIQAGLLGFLVSCVWSVPLPLSAQAPRGGGQFSRVTQLLNTQMPHVNVFDSRGAPLSTATLKGSYTVLVFGCLT